MLHRRQPKQWDEIVKAVEPAIRDVGEEKLQRYQADLGGAQHASKTKRQLNVQHSEALWPPFCFTFPSFPAEDRKGKRHSLRRHDNLSGFCSLANLFHEISLSLLLRGITASDLIDFYFYITTKMEYRIRQNYCHRYMLIFFFANSM